jgi:hypothetical protein
MRQVIKLFAVAVVACACMACSSPAVAHKTTGSVTVLSRTASSLTAPTTTSPGSSVPPSSTPVPPLKSQTGAETTAPTAVDCASASLSIAPGPRLSPQTGEEGIIAVRSASTRPCTISGYPAVTVYHGAQPIPFTYLDGEGQYVTPRKPAHVAVGPGKIAYFLVAKYRCDTGVAEQADSAAVRLSRQDAADVIPATWLRGLFGLCNRTAPPTGNTVTISPFEPATTLLGG